MIYLAKLFVQLRPLTLELPQQVLICFAPGINLKVLLEDFIQLGLIIGDLLKVDLLNKGCLDLASQAFSDVLQQKRLVLPFLVEMLHIGLILIRV
jgi:hypothetical protein